MSGATVSTEVHAELLATIERERVATAELDAAIGDFLSSPVGTLRALNRLTEARRGVAWQIRNVR